MGGNTYQEQTFPHVYGISGRKRHGKDTFSRILLGEAANFGASFATTHFAGELKRQAGIVFGLTHEQLDGKLKEAPLAEPVEMDNYLEAMSREAKLDLQPAGMVAKTPREIMQYLGTEYVRKAQGNYWVNVVLGQVRGNNGHIMVPDTRYPNEADALRSVGGKVIRIHRLDLPEAHDAHSSETEMEKINPDLFLGTVTDDFRLQTLVAQAICRGHFDYAQKFDYRKIEPALVEGQSLESLANRLDLTVADAEFVTSYYSKLNPR